MSSKNIFANLISIYNSNPNTVKTIFEYSLLNDFLCYVDSKKNTILHIIVKNKDKETLIHLLNFLYKKKLTETIINNQNIDGDTAIHIAVRNNSFDIAKLLEDAGINMTIKNNKGESVENDSSSHSPSHSPCDDILNKVTTRSFKDSPIRSFMRRSRSKSPIEKLMIRSRSKSPIEKLMRHSKYDDEDSLLNSIKKHFDYNKVKETEEKTVSEIFIKQLADEINHSRNKIDRTRHFTTLMGGKKGSKKGSKKNSKRKSKNKRSTSSSSENPSTLIHNEVVQHFINELKCSFDDAKALKAALYSLVKKDYPDLNNLQRAEKMKELISNKNIIKQIKAEKDKYLEIIANSKLAKEKSNNKSNDKK